MILSEKYLGGQVSSASMMEGYTDPNVHLMYAAITAKENTIFGSTPCNSPERTFLLRVKGHMRGL